MNKGSWGKVRAFFDLRTDEGFVIKGFKIIEGINGKFVSMPSQKGTNAEGGDEWYDTVWADKEVKDQLEQVAMRAYGQESVSDSDAATEPISTPTQGAESAASEPVKNEEFNEDDIPF